METDKLKNFIYNSGCFGGFVMKGNFNIPNNDFFLLFEEYLKTGINCLDDYAQLVYLTRDYKEMVNGNLGDCIDNDKFQYYMKLVSSNHFLTILFTEETLFEIREVLRYERRNDENIHNKIINQDRVNACSFTRKKDIRGAVMLLHGDKCLKCGSDKIALDHVIPIVKGGLNEIDNLQPLCKKCNSSKGDKIIDYRLKTQTV